MRNVIVVVNKMDEHNFSESAYENTKEVTIGILKSLNYSRAIYLPVSAFNGDNLMLKSL